MHSYLVRTAGFQRYLDVGMSAETLDYAIVRTRRLAFPYYRHSCPMDGMPPHGLVHGTAGGENAMHERLVNALDAAFLQLSDQVRMRTQRARDQHESGGVLVEAMDDAGTRQLRQFREGMQQTVQQSAFVMARSGVDDQILRLVDDQEVLVLVTHVQFHGFRRQFIVRREFNVNFDDITGLQSVLLLHFSRIYRQLPAFYPHLQARSRKIRKKIRSRPIQAQTGQRIGNGFPADNPVFLHCFIPITPNAILIMTSKPKSMGFALDRGRRWRYNCRQLMHGCRPDS